MKFPLFFNRNQNSTLCMDPVSYPRRPTWAYGPLSEHAPRKTDLGSHSSITGDVCWQCQQDVNACGQTTKLQGTLLLAKLVNPHLVSSLEGDVLSRGATCLERCPARK